jgi:hypothetical protein
MSTTAADTPASNRPALILIVVGLAFVVGGGSEGGGEAIGPTLSR